MKQGGTWSHRLMDTGKIIYLLRNTSFIVYGEQKGGENNEKGYGE